MLKLTENRVAPVIPALVLAVTAFMLVASLAGTTVIPTTGPPPSIVHHSTSAESAPSPSATTDDISVSGYDPTTVALSWARSQDACFANYFIQQSNTSDAGPWTTIDTIASPAVTALYETGFSAGTEVWFQDVDNAGCGGGSATSNVVALTFPGVASLSYSDIGGATVQLAWTNSGRYGGLLSFQSYQVQLEINGAGFSPVGGPITTESYTTDDVSGLSGLDTGTMYEFRVITTDDCNNCSGNLYPQSSDSNTVTHLALSQPVASPSSLQVGQNVQLSVAVIGGTGPFVYVWTGLPSGCTTANANPLSCMPTSTGTSSVSVRVSDSRGIIVTSLPVTVTVTASTTGGALSTSPISPTTLLVVALVVVVVAVVVLVFLRRRRKQTRSPAPALPSPPSSGGRPGP